MLLLLESDKFVGVLHLRLSSAGLTHSDEFIISFRKCYLFFLDDSIMSINIEFYLFMPLFDALLNDFFLLFCLLSVLFFYAPSFLYFIKVNNLKLESQAFYFVLDCYGRTQKVEFLLFQVDKILSFEGSFSCSNISILTACSTEFYILKILQYNQAKFVLLFGINVLSLFFDGANKYQNNY